MEKKKDLQSLNQETTILPLQLYTEPVIYVCAFLDQNIPKYPTVLADFESHTPFCTAPLLQWSKNGKQMKTKPYIYIYLIWNLHLNLYMMRDLGDVLQNPK